MDDETQKRLDRLRQEKEQREFEQRTEAERSRQAQESHEQTARAAQEDIRIELEGVIDRDAVSFIEGLTGVFGGDFSDPRKWTGSGTETACTYSWWKREDGRLLKVGITVTPDHQLVVPGGRKGPMVCVRCFGSIGDSDVVNRSDFFEVKTTEGEFNPAIRPWVEAELEKCMSAVQRHKGRK
jgi:hypothetical protein